MDNNQAEQKKKDKRKEIDMDKTFPSWFTCEVHTLKMLLLTVFRQQT